MAGGGSVWAFWPFRLPLNLPSRPLDVRSSGPSGRENGKRAWAGFYERRGRPGSGERAGAAAVPMPGPQAFPERAPGVVRKGVEPGVSGQRRQESCCSTFVFPQGKNGCVCTGLDSGGCKLDREAGNWVSVGWAPSFPETSLLWQKARRVRRSLSQPGFVEISVLCRQGLALEPGSGWS